MDYIDIFNLPGKDYPVLLADGKIGMLVVFPSVGGDGLLGIQVPGEEEHRWVHHDAITANNAGPLHMRQAGANIPNVADPADPQHLLQLDWNTRGREPS